ncbi:MAG: hypothetical protein LBO74_00815 [Candidatus Symbiothrix sp.]|nr:hypothetical protein [Candidatus Symbiothrix sp.]
MKKTVLIMFVAFLGLAYANAQTYVGGSLGIGSTTNKPKSGEKTTTSSFSFNPEVGYSLDEKSDIGIELLFGTKKEGKAKTSAYGASPYFRYSIAEFGQFAILGKASLYVLGDKSKANSSADELKSTAFGLGVTPILAYNLSDRIVLLANLNFLGLNFNQTSRKSGDYDLGTSTNFGLGIDTDDIVNIGGNEGITIGFAYKF